MCREAVNAYSCHTRPKGKWTWYDKEIRAVSVAPPGAASPIPRREHLNVTLWHCIQFHKKLPVTLAVSNQSAYS